VSGDIAPRILNLGADGDEWSASRSGRITPKEVPPAPTGKEALWASQSRSERGSEEKKIPSLRLPGTEPRSFSP